MQNQDFSQICVLFYKKNNEELQFFLGKNKISNKYDCFSEHKNNIIDKTSYIDLAVNVINNATLGFLNDESNNQTHIINNNSITYYNNKNKNLLLVIKYEISSDKIQTLNNITKYLNSNHHLNTNSLFLEFKWFKLNEIINFTGYFDQKFIYNLLKFLNDNNI